MSKIIGLNNEVTWHKTNRGFKLKCQQMNDQKNDTSLKFKCVASIGD